MQATKRTRQIEDEICERLSNGETLRAICRDEHMPHWTAVYQWMEADQDLALRIARARDTGFDAIAADSLDIVDRATSEDVQVAKLRAEHRLKLLAKWSPKKYGDRQQIDLKTQQVRAGELSDDELAAAIAGGRGTGAAEEA